MEYRKLEFNDDLIANGFLNVFTMLKTKENEFELYSGEHGNVYVDTFGTVDEAKQEAEKINIQNIKSVHLAVSYWVLETPVKKFKIINLADFLIPSSNVFIGRENGELIKQKTNFNELFEENDIVALYVDVLKVMSVSVTFWEGFVNDAVIKYGVDVFNQKVRIISSDYFNKSFNDGVEMIRKNFKSTIINEFSEK